MSSCSRLHRYGLRWEPVPRLIRWRSSERIGALVASRRADEGTVLRLMRMRSKKFFGVSASAAVFFGSLFAFQLPFREYPGIEYNDFPLPADWQQKAEWTFARLMSPPYTGRLDIGFGGFGSFGRFR